MGKLQQISWKAPTLRWIVMGEMTNDCLIIPIPYGHGQVSIRFDLYW